MNRGKQAVKLLFYAYCRGLARFVPPGLLYYLLWPYAALRGIRPALDPAQRHLPASRLPPPAYGDRPGFLARWRYQTSVHINWLPVLWYERWPLPRWRNRVTASGTDAFDAAINEHGIVLTTLHTVGSNMSGVWIYGRNIAIGSVLLPENVPLAELYSAQLTDEQRAVLGDSANFARGDTRAMLRFMRPGRVMFLPVDELRRYKTVDAAWDGGRIRLASGAFRLARLSRSIVFPMVVANSGRWRYRLHIGAPVPQELIEAGNDQAAGDHVAQQIMPIVARRAADAAPPLVWAVMQAGQVSSDAAGSDAEAGSDLIRAGTEPAV